MTVEVQGAHLVNPLNQEVALHWGVYRSDRSAWQHPEAVVPPQSYVDRQSGGMRSPMRRMPDGYSLTLTIPQDMAPLTVAFVVHVGGQGAGQYINPITGAHFSELVGMQAGEAHTLGVSLSTHSPSPAAEAGGTAINFAVRSRGAERVSLIVVKPPGGDGGGWGVLEVALDPWVNRTGDTWHVALSALRNTDRLCYGWRVEGDTAWETGNRFKPDQVLLDPCAPVLAYLPLDNPPPLPLPTIPLKDGRSVAVLGSLSCLSPQEREGGLGGSGGGEGLPLESLRLLELDVASFAQGQGSVQEGSYLGVAARADHVRAVGANAVLLAPAYATGPGIGPMGRAGVSFMGPDPQLSSSPLDPAAAPREFRAMVEQLHQKGVEVIMQFDLTYTAEGTDDDPRTLSFRGLDHAMYYRANANGVLNCGQVVVREYIVDVMRHWAQQYGVDGFCFVNAENLAQDRDGLVMDAPPLADALAMDPALSHLKLIAAPSDEKLLPRGGARGFPHWGVWMQRNNAFTRTMHSLILQGTLGLSSEVATRLAGSPDIFAAQWDTGMPGNLAAGRRPAHGINCVSTLGMTPLKTMADECAWLLGEAGAQPSNAPLATVIAKSLIMAAVLSQGVPLLTQDVADNVELARFTGVLIRLRKRLQPLLLPPLFDSPRDIRWHGAGEGSEPEWEGAPAAGADPLLPPPPPVFTTTYIAFSVWGPDGSALYWGINPHTSPIQVSLPEPEPGSCWWRVVDTSLEAPEDASLEGGAPLQPSPTTPVGSGGSYVVAAKASILLVAPPGQPRERTAAAAPVTYAA